MRQFPTHALHQTIQLYAIVASGGGRVVLEAGRPPIRRPPAWAQAFRSVIRMIATALLSLMTCSLVPLLQVQA